jgi:hypothetical protein
LSREVERVAIREEDLLPGLVVERDGVVLTHRDDRALVERVLDDVGAAQPDARAVDRVEDGLLVVGRSEIDHDEHLVLLVEEVREQRAASRGRPVGACELRGEVAVAGDDAAAHARRVERGAIDTCTDDALEVGAVDVRVLDLDLELLVENRLLEEEHGAKRIEGVAARLLVEAVVERLQEHAQRREPLLSVDDQHLLRRARLRLLLLQDQRAEEVGTAFRPEVRQKLVPVLFIPDVLALEEGDANDSLGAEEREVASFGLHLAGLLGSGVTMRGGRTRDGRCGRARLRGHAPR